MFIPVKEGVDAFSRAKKAHLDNNLSGLMGRDLCTTTALANTLLTMDWFWIPSRLRVKVFSNFKCYYRAKLNLCLYVTFKRVDLIRCEFKAKFSSTP